MSNLTSAIRGKITAGNNKYTNDQEKRAIVLETNKEDNRCVITVLTRDGIMQTFYNVPVLYSAIDLTVASWFPTEGDEVLIKERNKSYVIIGPVINRPNVSTNYDFFSYGTDDADSLLQ